MPLSGSAFSTGSNCLPKELSYLTTDQPIQDMPYTHFRYIAYEVPTVFKLENKSSQYSFNAGKSPEMTLLGPATELTRDARIRILRLISVMIKAYDYITRQGDSGETLKIFMAPEFYFRPNTDELAYNYAQYQAIKAVLRATIEADERFKDWLVVPGTIIWIWDGNSTKRPNPTAVKVYMNSAIFIKRGVKSKVIEKAEASGIDGIPDSGDKKYSHQLWDARYKTEAKKKKHFFKIETVQLGLEICLEHHQKILKEALSSVDLSAAGIDIQLLIAGGMRMNKQCIVAKKDGYVLRTDGFTPEYNFADSHEDDADPEDASDKDRVEYDDVDGHPDRLPPLVTEYANMRRVIKYRERVATTGKTLKDSTPGATLSKPFLTRMTDKHDIDDPQAGGHLLPVPSDADMAANATQRLRIFKRYVLPA